MREYFHGFGWHVRAIAVVIAVACGPAISSAVAVASPSTLAVRQSVAPSRLALPIPSPLDPTLADLPLDIRQRPRAQTTRRVRRFARGRVDARAELFR